MIQRSAQAFPEALDDDDDDVTWALQTAGVQWKRGAHADAIEWLRRAVESAVDGGHAIRAREIQQQANGLEAALKSGWVPGASSSTPAPPQRPPAQRNPFLDEDDGADRLDPYGELAVDIDVEPSFELRRPSRIPPRRSVRPPAESVPAEEVSEDELIEEVEEFDDADEAALAAPRLPYMSAPQIETSIADYDALGPDSVFPPRSADENRTTAPPSARSLAPLGSTATSPPRPPNLPPTAPSWPPPPAKRPPSIPPPSRPPVSRSPASRPAPSSPARSMPARAVPESPAPAWQQTPSAVSARPVPKLPATPPRPPVRTSAAPKAEPVAPRAQPVAPKAEPVAPRAEPISSEPPPNSRSSRAGRRPSERALALERKIAAAKALARQRMQEAGEEEEPTERTMESALPASNAPSSRSTDSYPPDTQVSSRPPSADFDSTPPDETTERDIEGPPPIEAAPPSTGLYSMPDSEPGTSPDIVSPFSRRGSMPPSEPTRQDLRVPESSQPPTESNPAPSHSPAQPSESPDSARTLQPARGPESIPTVSEEAPVSVSPTSEVPASAPPTSEVPLSAAPASEVPVSEAAASAPPVSQPPISAPVVSVALSEGPAISVASGAPLTNSEAPLSDAPLTHSEAPLSEAPLSGAPLSASRVSDPAPELRPTAIHGIELGAVPGLEDLPEDAQQDLVASAEIHTLGPDEEVSGFGLALVLEGAVSVMPAIADVSAAQARRGELIFSQGHLEEGVPIRVVAGPDGATVASFSSDAFNAAVRDCPWVGDELKGVGDRLQTLAGVAMGPMGEELDDMLRGLVIERCEVRRLLPNEVIAKAGKPVPGMIIVGAGRIELVDDEQSPDALDELGPGSFLYASQILQAAPAPHIARAGSEGALVLFAERKVAHELMVSVPPLLGIFAQ